MRGERPGLLQATALMNEACLRVGAPNLYDIHSLAAFIFMAFVLADCETEK